VEMLGGHAEVSLKDMGYFLAHNSGYERQITDYVLNFTHISPNRPRELEIWSNFSMKLPITLKKEKLWTKFIL